MKTRVPSSFWSVDDIIPLCSHSLGNMAPLLNAHGFWMTLGKLPHLAGLLKPMSHKGGFCHPCICTPVGLFRLPHFGDPFLVAQCPQTSHKSTCSLRRSCQRQPVAVRTHRQRPLRRRTFRVVVHDQNYLELLNRLNVLFLVSYRTWQMMPTHICVLSFILLTLVGWKCGVKCVTSKPSSIQKLDLPN